MVLVPLLPFSFCCTAVLKIRINYYSRNVYCKFYKQFSNNFGEIIAIMSAIY